jgi:hypothetical protein
LIIYARAGIPFRTSRIEHVPLVPQNPAQCRKLAVQHPPLETVPRTQVFQADFVFVSLCRRQRAGPTPYPASRPAYRDRENGLQLKFPALKNDPKNGGLTLPVEDVGGSWIVKLPSHQNPGVPENEYAMTTTARAMGMDVPVLQLIDVDAIRGLPL